MKGWRADAEKKVDAKMSVLNCGVWTGGKHQWMWCSIGRERQKRGWFLRWRERIRDQIAR